MVQLQNSYWQHNFTNLKGTKRTRKTFRIAGLSNFGTGVSRDGCPQLAALSSLEATSASVSRKSHSRFNGRGTGVGHDDCPTMKTYFAYPLYACKLKLPAKILPLSRSRPAIVNTFVRMLHKTM